MADDRTPFETRLADVFERYADLAPVEIDPWVVTQTAVASSGRGWRSGLGWRGNTLRAGVAMAAVVIVAVVGLDLLPGSSPGSGATPSASPSPSPSPTPAPTSSSPTSRPAPSDQVPYDDVPMDPGSYSVYGTRDGRQLRMTFEVPDGWFGHENWYVFNDGVDAAKSALVPYGLSDPISYIYADPCDRGLAEAVGPSVDDLVTALTTQQHRVVTRGPTDITVSGHAGQALEIGPDGALDPASCVGGYLLPWMTESRDERHIQPDLVQTIWIIDVDGQRLLIEGNYGPDTPAADRAELEAMMQSISISVD
jgi:hypothetical protein